MILFILIITNTSYAWLNDIHSLILRNTIRQLSSSHQKNFQQIQKSCQKYFNISSIRGIATWLDQINRKQNKQIPFGAFSQMHFINIPYPLNKDSLKSIIDASILTNDNAIGIINQLFNYMYERIQKKDYLEDSLFILSFLIITHVIADMMNPMHVCDPLIIKNNHLTSSLGGNQIPLSEEFHYPVSDGNLTINNLHLLSDSAFLLPIPLLDPQKEKVFLKDISIPKEDPITPQNIKKRISEWATEGYQRSIQIVKINNSKKWNNDNINQLQQKAKKWLALASYRLYLVLDALLKKQHQ